ncbi:unnamed protein product [Polarella glacialis]|uniref:Uncharacterized protein n=1 Tax=Polarella glacialis TaxID=89957 RepID=A0A813FZ32_POLGL|nr:unnamed protein product [Polarella glacialis]
MERHCSGSEYAAEWMRRSLRPLWPAPQELLPIRPPQDFCRSQLGNCHEEGMVLSYPPSGHFGLYPSPGYLRGCATAHARAGLLDHFLDSTLLSDLRTDLRSYLLANPRLASFVAEADGDEIDEDF